MRNLEKWIPPLCLSHESSKNWLLERIKRSPKEDSAKFESFWAKSVNRLRRILKSLRAKFLIFAKMQHFEQRSYRDYYIYPKLSGIPQKIRNRVQKFRFFHFSKFHPFFSFSPISYHLHSWKLVPLSAEKVENKAWWFSYTHFYLGLVKEFLVSIKD